MTAVVNSYAFAGQFIKYCKISNAFNQSPRWFGVRCFCKCQ